MLFKLPEKKCSGKRRYISVFCKLYSFIMIYYIWNTLFFLSKFRHGHQRLHGRLLLDKELLMLSTKTSQKWAKRTYTSTIHIFLPISTIFSNFFFHLLHLLMIFANNCLVKAVNNIWPHPQPPAWPWEPAGGPWTVRAGGQGRGDLSHHAGGTSHFRPHHFSSRGIKLLNCHASIHWCIR